MEVAQHWRVKAQRYDLQGSVCTKCGQQHFPPRAVCPNCAEEERSKTSKEQGGETSGVVVLQVIADQVAPVEA